MPPLAANQPKQPALTPCFSASSAQTISIARTSGAPARGMAAEQDVAAVGERGYGFFLKNTVS